MVQRVPVRVALDTAEVLKNPLRVGLSMEATVDVTDQSGKSLADTPRAASQLRTEVYAELDGQASAEVQRIIAANVGKKQ